MLSVMHAVSLPILLFPLLVTIMVTLLLTLLFTLPFTLVVSFAGVGPGPPLSQGLLASSLDPLAALLRLDASIPDIPKTHPGYILRSSWVHHAYMPRFIQRSSRVIHFYP